jgi:hypothetical protein
MKYSEKLKQRWIAEFQAFDWDKVESEIFDHPFTNDCGDIEGRWLIGSVFACMPSGKIYTCWTTNQTAKDIIRDQVYMEALEQVAGEYGFYVAVENGDLFLGNLLDCDGEYYLTKDGETFFRDGETFDDEKAMKVNMYREGLFPNVYWLSDHGDISLYTYNHSS